MEVDGPSSQLFLVIVALLKRVLHINVTNSLKSGNLTLVGRQHVHKHFDSDRRLSHFLIQKLLTVFTLVMNVLSLSFLVRLDALSDRPFEVSEVVLMPLLDDYFRVLVALLLLYIADHIYRNKARCTLFARERRGLLGRRKDLLPVLSPDVTVDL